MRDRDLGINEELGAEWNGYIDGLNESGIRLTSVGDSLC